MEINNLTLSKLQVCECECACRVGLRVPSTDPPRLKIHSRDGSVCFKALIVLLSILIDRRLFALDNGNVN